MNMALNHWDWTVIGLYFVFIVGIGFLFKHVNKNASDYFRGGGNMLWWAAGMSAVSASISTWSFTGAAAKVYQSGFMLPLAWMISAPITALVLWFLAPRFRQMRVITSIEGVARRFGYGTEQFYVYLLLPMALFWSGVGINSVAVFMSAALGVPTAWCIIGLALIVGVMSTLGGQWAVVASDFVQGMLMFLTVLVVVFLSLRLPEIGGLANLRNSLPERHFDFTESSRMGIVLMWFLVMQVMALLNTANLNGEGTRFLSVKDGRSARGMVLLRLILFFFIPVTLILQLPAMCAAVVFPDMSAVFPHLKVPEEGAFLAMAFKTLPQGMVGLLICGMFAAAMGTMDTGLNRNAGYFVRNVYIKYINRNASDSRQLRMGQVFTLVFMFITILIGLAFDHIREMNLFDVFQVLNSMVWVPSVVPTALGIVYKRTPSWSGWSTVLIGLAAGAIAKIVYTPGLFQRLMGYGEALNAYENADGQFIFISLVVAAVCVAWFFFTALFYEKSDPRFKEEVERFFVDMRTPIDRVREDVRDQDAMQYRLIGLMCLIFGGFTLLGILIPNPLSGRLGFLFVGGVIFAMGTWLYAISVRKFKKHPNAEI